LHTIWGLVFACCQGVEVLGLIHLATPTPVLQTSAEGATPWARSSGDLSLILAKGQDAEGAPVVRCPEGAPLPMIEGG